MRYPPEQPDELEPRESEAFRLLADPDETNDREDWLRDSATTDLFWSPK